MYYPFLIGDDRLEETHAVLRTLTHNSAPGMLEIEHLHRHAVEIQVIMARHPLWRRRQQRRETSKDHSNAATWDAKAGRGNLTIRSDFAIVAQWSCGLAKVEKSPLVTTLFGSFTFSSFATNERTMMRPRGALVGVVVDPSAPEVYVFTDTSMLDMEPIMDTMDDASMDAFLDFEDGLTDDLSGGSATASTQPSHASQQQSPASQVSAAMSLRW